MTRKFLRVRGSPRSQCGVTGMKCGVFTALLSDASAAPSQTSVSEARHSEL